MSLIVIHKSAPVAQRQRNRPKTKKEVDPAARGGTAPMGGAPDPQAVRKGARRGRSDEADSEKTGHYRIEEKISVQPHCHF